MKYLIMASCLTILMAAGCKKNKPKPKTELEKLPPITQTGANTFGCLLNGVAWIPKDNYGQANFKLDADPTFDDGAFGISAIRYYDSGKFESISFGSDSCKALGNYFFNKPRNRAGFADLDKSLVLISTDSGTSVKLSII